MLFPFSLEGAAQTWLEKEPPRSIHTWEDLVSKFVNYFFPPSKTTNLKNDIIAADGNLLIRTPQDTLMIIENRPKVLTKQPVVSKVNTTTSSSSPSLDITALTDIIKELVLTNKANQQASIKAIEETCVTCGGPHPYYECLATDSNTFNAYAATGTYKQGGNGCRPQGNLNYRARNQMRPLDFPPSNVQNNQNYNRYNQNQGNNNYQAPINQAQVQPSNEFSNYKNTNDVNLRAMQKSNKQYEDYNVKSAQ
nr:hypothetical protein [Tanacetum cinerariifolium]